jgi:hypothetical protein
MFVGVAIQELDIDTRDAQADLHTSILPTILPE